MNLYELATCGEDNELWGWIDAPGEEFMMIFSCRGRKACEDLTEFRMALLFVWWATR